MCGVVAGALCIGAAVESGTAIKLSADVEEQYQEVLKLYGLHKKVCESAVRISNDLKDTQSDRHRQHEDWIRMLEACDERMEELTRNLDDAKFCLGRFASATALETEKRQHHFSEIKGQ